MDVIKTPGRMTQYIESLGLEIRKNINQKTPALYGQGGHASNVITDFTIEFEHDALVQPLLYKSPTDFVTEFAEVAFNTVEKMGHTIAFVPVDKVFAFPPLQSYDEFTENTQNLAGIFITNEHKLNNSKLLKFTICIRSSLDIRFLKQTRNTWSKEQAEVVMNFLALNRLRIDIIRQDASSHVPVSIVANSNIYDRGGVNRLLV
jgi:hypothetical protein